MGWGAFAQWAIIDTILHSCNFGESSATASFLLKEKRNPTADHFSNPSNLVNQTLLNFNFPPAEQKHDWQKDSSSFAPGNKGSSAPEVSFSQIFS